MNTREKIWRKALELFNEHGLEQIGVREIARQLKISPGNLGYHFPTKQDIVIELAHQLRDLNNQTLTPQVDPSFRSNDFLEGYRLTFQNQYVFRFTQLAGAALWDHFPAMREAYRKIEPVRKQGLYNQLVTLIANKELREAAMSQLPLMVNQISLMARFWIQEARVSFPMASRDDLINHYLLLISGVFRPYTSDQGETTIANWMKTNQIELLR